MADKNKGRNRNRIEINHVVYANADEAKICEQYRNNPDVYDFTDHPAFKLEPSFTDCDGVKWNSVTYTADAMFKRYSQPDKTFVLEVKGWLIPYDKLRIKMFRQKYPEFSFIMVNVKGEDYWQAQKEARARKRLRKKLAQPAY